MALAGSQVRMARAHLRWSVSDLAEKSGVSVSTVKRGEAVDGEKSITGPNAAAIVRAFEAAGVIFVSEDGEGPDVRLRKAVTS